MEGRIEEGKISGAIDAIPLENVEKISEQMKTCIVKYIQVIKWVQDSFVKYHMKVRVFLS